MNAKIRKLASEIEKTERKIAELTDHLEDLKTRKEVTENDYIIQRVRNAASQGATLEEVMGLLNEPIAIPVLSKMKELEAEERGSNE